MIVQSAHSVPGEAFNCTSNSCQNPGGSCGCSGCSAAGWLVVAALLALPPPVLGRHAAALELWTRLVESGLCVCVDPPGGSERGVLGSEL